MLKIFRTSSGVSGASVCRSLFIETTGAIQHPRSTCPLGRNHMLLAPRTTLPRAWRGGRSGAERPRRQHHRNQPPVLHDIHTSQEGDVLEEATEIVLRVTGRYSFWHLAILAKTQ